MLTKAYIEALLVDEDAADQVWEAWDSGEIDDQVAWLGWWLIAFRPLCLGSGRSHKSFIPKRPAYGNNVQYEPPLPNEEWVPLWVPFSFGNEQGLNLYSRAAAQDRVEGGVAGRHN